MFILSKKLFFEYCEWMFDILEEFEKRVDISEKRFFISERLSGVFIAHLMRNEKYRFKILPITFIDEPIVISIALNYSHKDALNTAITIHSIFVNRKNADKYKFHLLCDKTVTETSKGRLQEIIKNYQQVEINFIDYENNLNHDVIAHLPELLKTENKLLYLEGISLAMIDIGEFMRICSVEDYFFVSLPRKENNPSELKKEFMGGITILNCNRMRKHRIWEKYKTSTSVGNSGLSLLSELCVGEAGYVPWHYFTQERAVEKYENIFNHQYSRYVIQESATRRVWLFFDKTFPWINNQGVYSIFWWQYYKEVGRHFNFVDYSTIEIERLYSSQQKELNSHKREENDEQYEEQFEEQLEEQLDYSIFERLVFYYQQNGLKQTIRHSVKKVTGKIIS
jgi:hypothetical protein